MGRVWVCVRQCKGVGREGRHKVRGRLKELDMEEKEVVR